MGEILLDITVGCVCIATLFKPWIGVVAYYTLALLLPQHLWWWVFEDVRASFIVSISTCVALVFHFVLKGGVSFQKYRDYSSLLMLLLWGAAILSYYEGDYVFLEQTTGGLSSQALFRLVNISFCFYFVSIPILNSTKSIKYLFYTFTLITLFYIYWANMQYITGNWYQFSYGRLMGPLGSNRGSIYVDENNFATVFVTGIPFIYFLGFMLKKPILKIFLWGLIPLAVHAIFLTGSRGGLVGLAAVIFIYFASKRNIKLLVLLAVFGVLFFQWQAGSVMKNRADTISTYKDDSSASSRLIAWQGGGRMILDHPVTGVGLGSFAKALPDYSDHEPLVAHNTFIQYAAESGLAAGLSYTLLVVIFFLNYRHNISAIKLLTARNNKPELFYINDAIAFAFLGYLICSFFLSLNYFEIFFFLALINSSFKNIIEEELIKETEL